MGQPSLPLAAFPRSLPPPSSGPVAALVPVPVGSFLEVGAGRGDLPGVIWENPCSPSWGCSRVCMGHPEWGKAPCFGRAVLLPTWCLKHSWGEGWRRFISRALQLPLCLGKSPCSLSLFPCLLQNNKTRRRTRTVLGHCEMSSVWHQCSRGLASVGWRALQPRFLPGLFLASTTAGAELGSLSSNPRWKTCSVEKRKWGQIHASHLKPR